MHRRGWGVAQTLAIALVVSLAAGSCYATAKAKPKPKSKGIKPPPPAKSRSGDDFTLPAGTVLPEDALTNTVPAASTNLDVQLYSVQEAADKVDVVIQVAVSDITACQSTFFGSPNYGCGALEGLAFLIDAALFGAKLVDASKATVSNGMAPVRLTVNTSTSLTTLSLSLALPSNSAARLTLSLPKLSSSSGGKASSLPQGGTALAGGLKVVAWGVAFKVHRALAPASALLRPSVTGKADYGGGLPKAGKLSAAGVDAWIAPGAGLSGWSVTVSSKRSQDLARPLYLRLYLAPGVSLSPSPAFLLPTAKDPTATLLAVPPPGNTFVFNIQSTSAIKDVCRQGLDPSQPPNSCAVQLLSAANTKATWLAYMVGPAGSPSPPPRAPRPPMPPNPPPLPSRQEVKQQQGQNVTTTDVLIDSLVLTPTTSVTDVSSAGQVAAQLKELLVKMQDANSTEALAELYNQYVELYGRDTKTALGNNLEEDLTAEEKARRRKIFLDNLAQVASHNTQPKPTFWLGVNSYSDMNVTEFKDTMQMPPASAPPVATFTVAATNNFTRRTRPPSPPPRVVSNNGETTYPKVYDWRSTRRMPEPKSTQGDCASGWAMSGLIALETAVVTARPFLKPGPNTSLSRQQVIDCAKPSIGNYWSDGCKGGWPMDVGNFAFEYGIILEQYRPYVGAYRPCPSSLLIHEPVPQYGGVLVVADEPSRILASDGDSALLLIDALQTSPVSVLFDASQADFQMYAGGVYESSQCTTDKFTHTLTVVGYNNTGTDFDPQGYWIVRNSWGTNWGQGGDAFIKMTPEGSKGMCGMYRYIFGPPRRFTSVPNYSPPSMRPNPPPRIVIYK